MPGLSHFHWPLAAAVVMILMAAGLSGCRRADEIHTYTVPKETSPPIAQSSAGPPAGHPFLDLAASPQPTRLRFMPPDSWRQLPASGMRKAAFEIAEGDARAEVTVFDFPNTAGSAIADPLANVNRWRAEVGLDPVAEDALSTAAETLRIGGQEGTFVVALPDAVGEPPSSQRGTLAAMVANGDRIWFFKLTGARDLAAAQQSQFRSFLESVQFVASEGAADGN
jgi:hypothetical protein